MQRCIVFFCFFFILMPLYKSDSNMWDLLKRLCNSFIFLYLFDIHNIEIIHVCSQAGMRKVNIDFGEYQQQAGYYSSVKDTITVLVVEGRRRALLLRNNTLRVLAGEGPASAT